MRHKVHSHTFGRRDGARKALVKGLMNSLVEHGRIKTTLAKARELRRHIERAVTIGKTDDINSRRLLLSRLGNEKSVKALVGDISSRFKSRPGGYTRILKLNPRSGDQAPMAFIEFVDYKLPERKDDETTVSGDKEAVSRAKAHAKKLDARRKSRRKMQNLSRKINR